MIDLMSVGAMRLPNGRTTYACFAVKGLDPRTLPGQTIRLDGREVLVDGVETFCVVDATRTDFGVVVRDGLDENVKENGTAPAHG